MTKHEKIADALRMIGRGNGMVAGLEATTTVEEIATVTKIKPEDVATILSQDAAKVWGKMPIGWTFNVTSDGAVTLRRRES